MSFDAGTKLRVKDGSKNKCGNYQAAQKKYGDDLCLVVTPTIGSKFAYDIHRVSDDDFIRVGGCYACFNKNDVELYKPCLLSSGEHQFKVDDVVRITKPLD